MTPTVPTLTTVSPVPTLTGTNVVWCQKANLVRKPNKGLSKYRRKG